MGDLVNSPMKMEILSGNDEPSSRSETEIASSSASTPDASAESPPECSPERAARMRSVHHMYTEATSYLTGDASPANGAPVAAIAEQSDKARRVLQELGRELICSVCAEVFVEASTLECGHSFCGPCIQNWLSMHTLSCPLCRAEVTKPPTRSMCLDKTVQALIQLADEESARSDLLSRQHRCSLLRNKESAAQKELEIMLARAARAGIRVVSIQDVWNEREQSRFQRGIAKLTGSARQSFCDCVGLNKEWIARATAEQLLVALANLKLTTAPCSWSDRNSASYCPNRIRCRLDMFVRYG